MSKNHRGRVVVRRPVGRSPVVIRWVRPLFTGRVTCPATHTRSRPDLRFLPDIGLRLLIDFSFGIFFLISLFCFGVLDVLVFRAYQKVLEHMLLSSPSNSANSASHHIIIYPPCNNHGSGQPPLGRGKSSSKGPLSTSMIVSGSVYKRQDT